MALVATPAMTTTFGMRDGEGSEANMRVHMADPTHAGLAAAAFPVFLQFAYGDLADSVQAMTDSPIIYFGVTMRVSESAVPAYGGGEVEMKGVFEFNNAQGRPSFRMAIPGLKANALTANGRDIELGDSRVVTFLGLMTSGAQRPVDANGSNLVGVPGGMAYKQHRRSSGGSGRHTG